MQIVFHPDFHGCYTGDPAAEAGRLEPVEARLRSDGHAFVRAAPAPLDAIARVHAERHIAEVRADRGVYAMALLAAGGALRAAELAAGGEPAFALIRPPGHHASAASCWGFCYFNNVAVAVEHLLHDPARGVRSVSILDIDLHFGDGTAAIFRGRSEVTYAHPEGSSPAEWLERAREAIDRAAGVDLIAVSAGFDRHEEDWGELLATEDYLTLGRWLGEAARQRCEGRLFAVLEGGYDPSSMAEATAALVRGMSDGLATSGGASP
jgi:acetoin utilization deacetylase AcuC-like enzyme